MKVWTPEERLAYLFDAKPPFEAGKGWDYSDTNYIVLGMIIERVTGRRFYDEANRRVIRPLKLKDTIPQEGRVMKGVIQGYAGTANPFGGKDAMMENGKFLINPRKAARPGAGRDRRDNRRQSERRLIQEFVTECFVSRGFSRIFLALLFRLFRSSLCFPWSWFYPKRTTECTDGTE